MAIADYEFHIDWNGNGDFSDISEDVTGDVLRREPLSIVYGRDQTRSLSPMRAGEASFLLNNISRDYSPENDSSPLAGNILPGRPVRIRATHNLQTHSLFRGFTDDYDVLPDLTERAVKLTFLDALARFRGTEISTELHHGIRTGEAIGLILDAIGWPKADRDLDLGATFIRWWWKNETDAFTTLEEIVNSEGPPALATVGPDGKFVFRDRHHRLTDAASLTSQATFSDVDIEPVFSRPLIYDHGWRDIINSVTLSVQERSPTDVAEVVWSSDATYSIADGETLPVRTQLSDPVINAISPVAGIDYRIRSGTVTVSLIHTTGTAITISLTASGGPAIVDQLQLRAFPVEVRRTVQVHVEDSVSIDRYGRRTGSINAPFANVHDALAIAEIILAHRAERLPIVQMLVINKTVERLTEQLGRDLSDRITIVEPELGLNDDFYIEQIAHHSIGSFRHETTFGCEQAPTQIDSAFTFDVAGRGFGDGKFGLGGLSDPDNIFRFDTAGQGFDDGLLAY